MQLILAQPRGFCAGVDRAIEIVERALEKYGAPVYVRHEIVHNKYVVEDLRAKGAVFVKEVDEIPTGAITIFSAHGVSEKVETNADGLGLKVIDATCPLVTKVHNQAQRFEKGERELIIIGHKGHPELEGTYGRVKQKSHIVENISDANALVANDPENLAYVTQTTLSVSDTREIIDVLKQRFPSIEGPELKDICYATQNRQDAVRELAKQVDIIFVVGARNSSNSNRLRDLAEECGVEAFLVDDVKSIPDLVPVEVAKIGLTAGASAPEILVQQIVDYFKDNYSAQISIMNGIEENVKFKLPKEVA